jgi:putative transposase
MCALEYKLFYQRQLPHYQPPGAILFITFGLAGSLPRKVLQQLEAEISRGDAEICKFASEWERKKAAYTAQKYLFNKMDNGLHSAPRGPKWLADPQIAGLVCEALHYRDGKQYELEAYSIMPNHVHIVFTPKCDEGEPYPLSRIMQSLKGNTARKANQLLGRQGAFWKHESYDHVVRDNQEFKRIVDYVVMNPVRASLPPRWVYRRSGCV